MSEGETERLEEVLGLQLSPHDVILLTDRGVGVNERMKYEGNRLGSYLNWPVQCPVSPLLLVKAGFYFSGEGTTTTCFACEGSFSDWTSGDDPQLVHRQKFPHCPFVTGKMPDISLTWTRSYLSRNPLTLLIWFKLVELINLSAESRRHLADLPRMTNERLGVKSSTPFEEREERLRTYGYSWPRHSAPSPEKVSDAGFFYLGYLDFVKCFSCGVVVSNWTEDEDPLTRHERLSPTCQFVCSRGEERNDESDAIGDHADEEDRSYSALDNLLRSLSGASGEFQEFRSNTSVGFTTGSRRESENNFTLSNFTRFSESVSSIDTNTSGYHSAWNQSGASIGNTTDGDVEWESDNNLTLNRDERWLSASSIDTNCVAIDKKNDVTVNSKKGPAPDASSNTALAPADVEELPPVRNVVFSSGDADDGDVQSFSVNCVHHFKSRSLPVDLLPNPVTRDRGFDNRRKKLRRLNSF